MSIQSIQGMQYQKFLFVMCKTLPHMNVFFLEILPHLGKALELRKTFNRKTKQKTTSYFYTVQI